jgi:hypothetical protein
MSCTSCGAPAFGSAHAPRAVAAGQSGWIEEGALAR